MSGQARVVPPRVATVAFVAVLLSVALTGCLDGAGDGDPGAQPGPWAGQWSKDPCDPSEATGVSRNAPVVDAYTGSPEAVVGRLADAVGEDLPPYRGRQDLQEGPLHTWRNDSVKFTYQGREKGRLHALRYVTSSGYKPWSADPGGAERALRSTLATFGIPDHVELEVEHRHQAFDRYNAWQLWRGDRVERRAATLFVGDAGSDLKLWLVHDRSGAEATLSRQQANETAKTYHRCAMDRQGRTADDGYRLDVSRPWWDPLQVRHESLTYVFALTYTDPDPGHCGNLTQLVHVDAVTGAVHGWRPPLCD